MGDVVAYLAENSHHLLIAAADFGRVGKAQWDSLTLAQLHRAIFGGVITDGYYCSYGEIR